MPRKNFKGINRPKNALEPTKTIELVAPNGLKFSIELTNPEVLDRMLSSTKAQLEACEPALNFLDQVSQVLFQSTFESLVPAQRNIVWNCIRDCKHFGNFFLERLILAMDSSFHKSVNSDSEIVTINPSLLFLFASKIFHCSSYLSMTTTERRLLRFFLIKTNGAITQWTNETNTKLIGIINKVEKLMIWPKRSRLSRAEVEIDRKLSAIYKKDEKQIANARNQQALLDYESPFEGLHRISQAQVNRVIGLENKVRLLDSEKKDPFTLDEAAYFAYLIPYNMLSPFAQYCATR
jgi:hypothetical protein